MPVTVSQERRACIGIMRRDRERIHNHQYRDSGQAAIRLRNDKENRQCQGPVDPWDEIRCQGDGRYRSNRRQHHLPQGRPNRIRHDLLEAGRRVRHRDDDRAALYRRGRRRAVRVRRGIRPDWARNRQEPNPVLVLMGGRHGRASHEGIRRADECRVIRFREDHEDGQCPIRRRAERLL